jgi:hypothetical protein
MVKGKLDIKMSYEVIGGEGRGGEYGVVLE